MEYNSGLEKTPFDARAAEYELWYTTPQGRYVDAAERKLFLKLVRPKQGQSILDVGCGTGHNLEFFSGLGLGAAGIDASKPMLDSAARKLKDSVGLHLGNAEELRFDTGSFDIVTLITVLEFVSNPKQVLKEAARVAREQVYLGVLNKASLLAGIRRIKGRFRESIYNQARFYSIWQIEAMVRKAVGDVPLKWQSTLFFPLGWHRYTRRLDKLLINMPFGAFLGIRLDVGNRELES